MGTHAEDGQAISGRVSAGEMGVRRGPQMAVLPRPSLATKNPGWGQAGAQPLAQEGPGSRWHQEGVAERAGMGAGRLGEAPEAPLPLWVVLAHLLALPGLHQ